MTIAHALAHICRFTGQTHSDFLDQPATTTALPSGPANGITSITRHQLKG